MLSADHPDAHRGVVSVTIHHIRVLYAGAAYSLLKATIQQVTEGSRAVRFVFSEEIALNSRELVVVEAQNGQIVANGHVVKIEDIREAEWRPSGTLDEWSLRLRLGPIPHSVGEDRRPEYVDLVREEGRIVWEMLGGYSEPACLADFVAQEKPRQPW